MESLPCQIFDSAVLSEKERSAIREEALVQWSNEGKKGPVAYLRIRKRLAQAKIDEIREKGLQVLAAVRAQRAAQAAAAPQLAQPQSTLNFNFTANSNNGNSNNSNNSNSNNNGIVVATGNGTGTTNSLGGTRADTNPESRDEVNSYGTGYEYSDEVSEGNNSGNGTRQSHSRRHTVAPRRRSRSRSPRPAGYDPRRRSRSRSPRPAGYDPRRRDDEHVRNSHRRAMAPRRRSRSRSHRPAGYDPPRRDDVRVRNSRHSPPPRRLSRSRSRSPRDRSTSPRIRERTPSPQPRPRLSHGSASRSSTRRRQRRHLGVPMRRNTLPRVGLADLIPDKAKREDFGTVNILIKRLEARLKDLGDLVEVEVENDECFGPKILLLREFLHPLLFQDLLRLCDIRNDFDHEPGIDSFAEVYTTEQEFVDFFQHVEHGLDEEIRYHLGLESIEAVYPYAS